MSIQKNDESDFDFSVIDKKSLQEAKLDFSVESLLQSRQQQNSIQYRSQEQQQNIQLKDDNYGQQSKQQKQKYRAEGSFMQDLQKLQQSLSFQTQLYNVYQEQTQTINLLNPLTKSYFHAKSNSHLKTTKEQSTGPIQIDDYGYLVIDFASYNKKKPSKPQQIPKLNPNKIHSQKPTFCNKKCNSSSASLIQSPRNTVKNLKSHKSRNSSLYYKWVSPLPIKNQRSSSKQKSQRKTLKSKSKDCKKDILLNKLQKKITRQLSKTNASQKTLNNKSIKKANQSTTIAESKTTNKSNTKSSNLEGNAISEYYGFEEIADSERIVIKSNCISIATENKIVSPRSAKDGLKTFYKNSKPKFKKPFNSPSPSNKDLTMRFKKNKLKPQN